MSCKALLVRQCDGHVGGGGGSLQWGMHQWLPDHWLAAQLSPSHHWRQILDVMSHVTVMFHNLLDHLVIHAAGAVFRPFAQQDGVLLTWGGKGDKYGRVRKAYLQITIE